MPTVAQGGSTPLDSLFRTGTGQPIEPSSVSLQIRDPAGNVVVGPVGVPPIVDTGLGTFLYTWTDASTLAGLTGSAATDVLSKTAHGLSDGETVRFVAISGGAGFVVDQAYYVRDVTANTFKLADTVGGPAVDFTTDITDARLAPGHWLGTWVAEWSGTIAGSPGVGYDNIEVVLPGSIVTGPYDFLIMPDDGDAIRALLGEVAVGLQDETIELPVFAGQAEQRVKNRISNWATQILDPERRFALRNAAAYATAALLAESWARGGTVGNIFPHPEGVARWTEQAALLWQRFEEWMAAAEAWDIDTTATYNLNPLMARGPTKAARISQPLLRPVPMWAYGWNTRWAGWTF